MKYSGLYLISNPSNNPDAAAAIVNTLVSGIETSFPTAARQPPWILQYRVFRDTIPPTHKPAVDAENKPIPFAHTLQHHLHLSSLEPNRTYICTQPPTGPSTVIGIPKTQQDDYATLVRNSFAALWQARHALVIQQGITHTGGICTVHIGELRSKREGLPSGSMQSPGVVVCISTVVGSDDADDEMTEEEMKEVEFGDAQEIIRDFWGQIKADKELGKGEVRELMMAPKYEQGFREKDAAVRMWCEALRLRG